MDTKTLARHYQSLTPWERLPLMVAAAARDDDIEMERLASTAPRHGWRLPNYYGLHTALSDLAMLYLIRQTDLVAAYWRATALEQQQLAWRLEGQNELQVSVEGLRKIYAMYFLVDAEAWKLLCADLKIDGDAMLRDAPSYETLQDMEIEARGVAFRPEEAVKFLRQHHQRLGLKSTSAQVRSEFHFATAAEVARSMRASLENEAQKWN